MADQGKAKYQLSFVRMASALALSVSLAMIGLPAEIVVIGGFVVVVWPSGTPRQDVEAMGAAVDAKKRDQ